MARREVDLGPVDAYAIAVAEGYTGTREQWVRALADAESNSLKAEGYAVGEQNGTPVETGEYFENNAKYYSEQALNEKEGAEAAKSGAEAAQTAAETAQTAAETAQTAAETAQTAAETAQTAAEAAAARDTAAWLNEHITNPNSPPLDRTLLSSSAAAPADMVGELKSAIDDTDGILFTDATVIDQLSFTGNKFGKTNKPVLAFLPKNTYVKNLKLLISADVASYVTVELWTASNGTYTKEKEYSALTTEAYSSNYLVTYPTIKCSKDSFLTYKDSTSSGVVRNSTDATATLYMFPYDSVSITKAQMSRVARRMAFYISYVVYPIPETVAEIDQSIQELNDCIEPKSTVYLTTLSNVWSNALNAEYIWMLKTPIKKGANPHLSIIATEANHGAMRVYLLSKNANETYHIENTVNITTVAGENIVTLPDGAFDENDIYLGVYSESGGILYNGSGTNRKEYARCSANDAQNVDVTMSGSYNMDFSMELYYVLYNNINDKIEKLEQRIVIVDASGNGDYISLLEAMQTEPENTVIIVKPGVYNQDMTSCLKKRVVVLGTDRNQCIIRDADGRYEHHPLYVSCGYFENLTIAAPYVSGTSQEIGVADLGAYAVHIDTDDDYGIGKQIEFHHCNITSDFFPAIGAGLRKNMTLILDDCLLENGQIANRGDYSDEGSLGALYFHDSNGEQGDQYIVVKNCVLKSKLKYAMCPYQVNRTPQNNHVYCDFINNVLYSDVGRYTDTVWFRRDPFNPLTGIFSIGIGCGNSISTLNNNT